MRKTIYGTLIGSAAGAGLMLAFFAFDLWQGRASSADWAERRSALAGCALLGWLTGSLRDAAQAERLGGGVRVVIGLGLGAISGLFCARVANWPAAGDRSVLYLAAGVLSGAVLLKATAHRRPPVPRRSLRRWRQFSLRGLLIAVTLIGAALALLTSGPIQRWRLSSELTRRGVQIRYDESTWNFWRFLLGRLAEPFFDDIASAELSRSAGDEEVKLLASRGGTKILRLGGSRVTNAGLASLTSFDRLTLLGLRGAAIDDGCMQDLRHLEQLQLLDIGQTGVSDQGLVALSSLPHLSHLGLAGCNIGDSAMASLLSHPHLFQLDLSNTKITDAGLFQLGGLTRLTSLCLNGTAISDDGLAHLQELVELQRLELKRTNVTDAGLERLQALKQLAWLDLGGTQVTGSGLGALRDLPKLSQLGLNGTPLGDAAMEEIGRFGELVSLDLTAVPISDARLASLADLTKLEALTLDGTGITDAGLKNLEGMTKLRALYVRRTGVTKQGIQRLQTAQYAAKLRVADDPVAAPPPMLRVVP